MENNQIQRPQLNNSAEPTQSFIHRWLPTIAGVVIVVFIGGGVLAWQYFGVPGEENKDEIKELLIINRVLSDNEVIEILKIFAETPLYREKTEIGYLEILLDALERKNENLEERLANVKKGLNDWGSNLEDAPDFRSFSIASTKACIAESIIYNDPKNTLQRCGIDDKAIDNVWIEENDRYRADDTMAVSQILPYFLTAISYNTEGDMLKAGYYIRQIKFHREAIINQYGENALLSAGELYEKIFEKVARIETVNWQTYRNDEFGFEVKHPNEWTLEIVDDIKNALFINIKSPSDNLIIICPTLGGCLDHGLMAYYEKDQKTVLLGGEQMAKSSWYDELDDTHYVTFLRPKNVWQYKVDYNGEIRFYTANNNKEKDLATFNQILSTFKFIKPTGPEEIYFLSPQIKEQWKIGETYTIKITQPIKESYPFRHLTLNRQSGEEVGIISCKIGDSGKINFNWEVTSLLNYCGAGLEGKIKEVESGTYMIAITKDVEGRPMIVSSDLFSIILE